ncbi:MAG: GIY-YIG nuclease family protein [Candidatus Marinimicrobia bacterium]|nr:GIY-YIG nuclease family protein [Candidatus Neomarinimicrobiota bacterium]
MYVLISISTEQLYIGHTNNIERRLNEHNKGKSISTRNRGPWKLVGYITRDTRSEAMKIEKRLKSFKRSDRVIAYLAKNSD